MTRREFITLLGGAAATWPLAARAQQAMPVIGFLGSQSPGPIARSLSALQEGLKETGYIVGQNVTIEFLWADDQYDRLPAMAADLVRRPVAVIVAAGGNVSARAAKAATSTIPIVFPIVTDPVKDGLVASINRPGGNVTGIAALTIELDPKRLELLCELVPAARVIGALIDSNRPEADNQTRALQAAAQTAGRQLVVARVAAEREFDVAIASLIEKKADALVVGASPFFFSRREQLVALAARRHGGPAAIARVRKNQPAAYCKLLTLLCPRDVKVEHSGGVKAMTDEQLEAGIEAIQAMLAARALGDRAKLIEGTAETVALPAPDPDDKPRRPNKIMDAADTAVGPKERKPKARAVA